MKIIARGQYSRNFESESQVSSLSLCLAMLVAGFFASIFLIFGVVGVPQWKCKKYDIGNVDKKVVMFINYADCMPENCLLNATMLSNLGYLMRKFRPNQMVLLVEESVEIPIFKRKNRVGQYLLVKHIGNQTGLNVDRKLFGSSGVLIFDEVSSLVYKLPYIFEFQRKKNMTTILMQKNYQFIIKASMFATFYENVCGNEGVSWFIFLLRVFLNVNY